MPYYSPKGAWIGGVAKAIADRLGLNVIAVRLVALVALAVFPIATGLLYLGAAWFLRRQQVNPRGARQRPWRAEPAASPEPVRKAGGAPLRTRMRDLESRLAEIEAEIVASEMNEIERTR